LPAPSGRSPLGGRNILQPAEDAIEVLYAAKAAIVSNLSASRIALLEKSARFGDAAAEDEVHHR
jgi:hypothetical protein